MTSWKAQIEALEYTELLELHGLEAHWRQFLLEGCGRRKQGPRFQLASSTDALLAFGQVVHISAFMFSHLYNEGY